MLKSLTIASVLAVSTFAAIPAAAEARGYDRYSNSRYERGYDRQHYRGDRYDRANRYYGRDRYYSNNRRCSGTTGTIVGAVAGGLLGHEVVGRRGDKTAGTIIGGAVGALAGRAIDKGDCRR